MSSDLLVNSSAMTALLALNQTQQNLNTYENQVSTGLAISSAQQNAAYWSIATSMNTQIGALGAVSSSLSESGSLLSTMNAALQQTVTIMNNINNDLITAQDLVNKGDTADLAKTQQDIGDQIQSLLSLGQSTQVNGVNFLQATAGATVNLLSSYNPASGSQFITIATGTTTALFNTATTGATSGILGTTGAASGLSVLNFNVVGASAAGIANMITDLGKASTAVQTAASVVGATQNNVVEQQSFISNLSDSLTSAVGSLVDADMNQASTKISALQVQQQLGVQALSIANSNTQLILKLFGQ